MVLLTRWVYQLTQEEIPAKAAGLFFAVFPSHPEVVTWIRANVDLLASAFSLLALLAYQHWRKNHGWRWLGLMLSASALAMLSKEFAYLLPLLIPLFDLFATRPAKPDKTRLAVWGLVLGLAATFWLIKSKFALGQLSHPTGVSPLSQAPWNWLSNLNAILWPKLPLDRPAAASALWTLASLGLLSLNLLRPRRRLYLFAPTVLLLTGLVPGSVVNRVGPEGEFSRMLYFPCLGLAALLGTAVCRERLRLAVAIGLPAWLIAFLLSWWTAQPWITAGKLSTQLHSDFQQLKLPLHPGDSLFVAGVPIAVHSAVFHNNSYTLSVALSIARFPEEFRRRGFDQRNELPLYAISPAVPEIEARMLTIPRLRRLKTARMDAFDHRLLWQAPNRTFRELP